MTGYVLRTYDPTRLSHATQEGYQQEIHQQLARREGYMTVPGQAREIALIVAYRHAQEHGVGIFADVAFSQFFLLSATLEQILDEVLFETEEEVLDGDGTLYTDLPKEEQDALCALLLNLCLQTLWPAAFFPSPLSVAGEAARSEEKGKSPVSLERHQAESLAMEAQTLANWLAMKEMVDDCYGEGKVSHLKVQTNFDGVETSLDRIVAYDHEGHILSFDRSLPLFTEDVALLPAYAPQLADDDLLFWIDNRYQIPRISTTYMLDCPPLLTFTVEATRPEKEDHTR